MTAFGEGFSDEIVKLAVGPLGLIGMKAGSNLAEYVGVMNIPKVREVLGNLSNEVMRTGFKHGLTGKKVPRASMAGIVPALGLGSAPMLIYEQGWQYGRRVAQGIEKVPGLRAMHPINAARAVDTGLQTGIKGAPAIGAAAGAGLGLVEEKAHHPRRELTKKEIGTSLLEGGAKGALLGAGVRRFGPHAPGPKQLHKFRTEYLDRLTGGGSGRGKIERFFDWSAKPHAAAAPLKERKLPGH